jgi:hypothetical protein
LIADLDDKAAMSVPALAASIGIESDATTVSEGTGHHITAG